MTVSDLIKELQQFADDTEIRVERGDWGPCVVRKAPRLALVNIYNGESMNWEILFPECEPDEFEVRKEVVIL